jgi:myo-inositol 2-dehydrogenase / D-chiro-inositol 1-dehydrogenase
MRIGLVGVARMEAFHGATLQGLDGVEQVVVTEASPARAQAVVKGFDLEVAPDVETLLAAGLDGVAISAASAHTELIGRAQDAGLTTFCQKPAASDLAGSLRITDRVADGLVPVDIGFQPCFVAGLRAARDAVTSGSLGWIHTMRASTNDAAPPHASYIPTSGGFIRDISIHDFEAVRFVADSEVIIVCAVGQNRDEAFFAEPDDIDAAASVLTMDDATIALISGSRFNGKPGLRLRRNGRPTALRSVEAGMDFPAAMAYTGFMERFHQGCSMSWSRSTTSSPVGSRHRVRPGRPCGRSWLPRHVSFAARGLFRGDGGGRPAAAIAGRQAGTGCSTARPTDHEVEQHVGEEQAPNNEVVVAVHVAAQKVHGGMS